MRRAAVPPHRGVQVVPSTGVKPETIDGIVMSNINPAQIDKRLDALRSKFSGPVLRLWQPKLIGNVFPAAIAA